LFKILKLKKKKRGEKNHIMSTFAANTAETSNSEKADIAADEDQRVFDASSATTPSGTDEIVTNESSIGFEIAAVHQDKIKELRLQLSAEMNTEFSDLDCERFLIARNFDFTKTIDMLTKRFEWYNAPLKDMKIDNPSLRPRDLLREVSDNKEELFNQYFGCSNLGFDKDGTHATNAPL
jgi:hypothetical protein